MEGQIPEQVKTQRSHTLIELGNIHKKKYMEKFIEKEAEILFEEQCSIHGKTYWTGYTKEYLKVVAESEESLENQIKIGQILGFLEEGTFICTINS